MSDLKNPNTLHGREGALLQVIDWNDLGIYYVAPSTSPQRGDIVMLVAIEETDEYHGSIQVLHSDKVFVKKTHPKNWMRHFIPWPHGGFVG